MTETIPQSGRKYGRRAPKRASAIQFSRIHTGAVPAHPVSIDHLGADGWQMLGNDRAGDCVAVTWANIRRLVTAICGAENYPAQDAVWTVYRTQNPDFDPDGDENTNGPGSEADRGMDIQTLLEYLVKTGGPDGVKALAFARVDPTDVEQVKAAIAIFGYVWTGVTVQAVNQVQFENNKPWDYSRTSPDEGGHSVITGGYGSGGTGALGGDERFITWAQETSFTDRYWDRNVDETWVVIWPEHLQHPAFLEGIDLTELAAAYEEITGRQLPVNVPPTPEPTPTPAPADPDLAMALAARTWLDAKGI